MMNVTAMEENEKRKVIIGLCGMSRKVNSKPMKAIMNKMTELYEQWLEFVVFKEETILKKSVEDWPLCDCLISFYANGFPLEKAIKYAKLRRPYVINDLEKQFDLQSRAKIYAKLKEKGLEVARHAVMNRDEGGSQSLIEHGDSIEVNGCTFNKPFVEKPISAEDHNIHIYYPSSAGGGSQRLFRKVKNRSSEYSKESSVRTSGNFIYEDFVPAEGIDIKVYAVGPFYAHAEARKSPALDGKVDRDHKGKEIRYPVILNAREKEIAHQIVVMFGQTVCGFDLLRANGKSYVCDVNGFSFVKTSTKYYEDSARILGNQILCRLAHELNIPWSRPFQPNDPPRVPTSSGKVMELRCVLAVIRHGDRTPKQKIKIFLDLFETHGGKKSTSQAIKMKKPSQLNAILELVRDMLAEQRAKIEEIRTQASTENRWQHSEPNDSPSPGLHECSKDKSSSTETLLQHSHDLPSSAISKELHRLEVLVSRYDQYDRDTLCAQQHDEYLRSQKCHVTEPRTYGHFSGINRKVQLKNMQKYGQATKKAKKENAIEDSDSDEDFADGCVYDESMPALLLIVKWGGELTTAGIMQAEALGKLFRTLYPGIRGGEKHEDKRGLGFLRLHSTYRHDLKIYASEEGRVQMTAAAFTRGLLALEGELPPILVQMVKSANTDGLLDDDNNATQFRTELKKVLHAWMQVDRDLTPGDMDELNPLKGRAIRDALEFIKNPRRMCEEIYGYVQMLYTTIQINKMNNRQQDKSVRTCLYQNETWELAERRWGKLMHDFRRPSTAYNDGMYYDISKIPDIYDNVKYDMEHNPELCLNHEEQFERMYLCVKNVADVLVPSEYGIKKDGKLTIAQGICTPLMRKLQTDLKRCVDDVEENGTRLDPSATEGIATPHRHVRTRLYFTSESHIHTLMNLIQHGGLDIDPSDRKWQRAMTYLQSVTEFNYMTQLVMMLYEDTSDECASEPADRRFRLELVFSPGLYPCFQTEKERIIESGHGCQTLSSGQTMSLSCSLGGTPRPNDVTPPTSTVSGLTVTDVSITTTKPSCQHLAVLYEDPAPNNNNRTSMQRENSSNSSASLKSVSSATTLPSSVLPVGESRHTSEEVESKDDDSAHTHVRLTRLDEVRRQEEFTSAEVAAVSPPLSPASVRSQSPIDEAHLNRRHRDTSMENALHSSSSLATTMSDKNEQRAEHRRRRNLSEPNVCIALTHVPRDLSPLRMTSLPRTSIVTVSESPPSSTHRSRRQVHEMHVKAMSATPTKPLTATASSPVISRIRRNTDTAVDSDSETNTPTVLTIDSSDTNEQESSHKKTLLSPIADRAVSPLASTKRRGTPYRFKHSMLTYLKDAPDKLISNAVITGGKNNNDEQHTWHAQRAYRHPVVMGTAVIGRSNSAPKLQMAHAGEDFASTEIRRFWPPLRSLETLHDHIPFAVFDEFCKRVTTVRTPAPSPPKTPRDISRENSDLTNHDTTSPKKNTTTTGTTNMLINETARKLRKMTK